MGLETILCIHSFFYDCWKGLDHLRRETLECCPLFLGNTHSTKTPKSRIFLLSVILAGANTQLSILRITRKRMPWVE